jgi:mannose-1-phosphate guanylyltransferase
VPITDAIILAGGFGTRLKPLTQRTPKSLLPVAGRPFLESLFARLAQAGLRRVVLSVHHQAEELRRALPTLRRYSLAVTLRRERRPLGTGGAIRWAWPDAGRPCLVLNGDALSDFDLRALMREHRRTACAATLWAIAVERTEAFGVLETDARGRVTRFVEKPRPGQSRSRLINAGAYVLRPDVLTLIPRGRAVSVEREVFPALLERGLMVGAFVAERPVYWNDIGTPQAYLRANMDVLRGNLWGGGAFARRLWGRPDRGGNLRAASARVAAGADVSLSVLGPGCRVEAGAVVRGSVLLDGCRVGPGSSLDGALLAQGVAVGARCTLKSGVVLGADSRLSDDTHL